MQPKFTFFEYVLAGVTAPLIILMGILLLPFFFIGYVFVFVSKHITKGHDDSKRETIERQRHNAIRKVSWYENGKCSGEISGLGDRSSLDKELP